MRRTCKPGATEQMLVGIFVILLFYVLGEAAAWLIGGLVPGSVLGMVLLFVSADLTVIYIAIALIGFGNSNVFSIVFSQALLAVPDKKNEISGLMIMGLFGGTVFPLLMGFASDAVGQSGAVAVMTAGVIYLIIYMFKLKR